MESRNREVSNRTVAEDNKIIKYKILWVWSENKHDVGTKQIIIVESQTIKI